MRLLVLGSGGQVGSGLIRALGPAGTVLPADRSTLDLSRVDTIRPTLDRLRPDLVINAAAYTEVDRAEADRDLAYRVNAEAPGEMALWAAETDTPLVHFSTDYVFDGSGGRPWREDDQPAPLSVYGASKLAGEDRIRGAQAPSLILRTSWVYAAEGKNFLRTIAGAAQTRQELRVVSDQIGAPTSATLIASTVASMLTGGLEAFRDKLHEADGLVHLTAAGEASWHNFADEIVKGLQARQRTLAVTRIVPIATEDWPTPARRPLNSRLSLARMQTVFGIAPPDWRVALAAELDRMVAGSP